MLKSDAVTNKMTGQHRQLVVLAAFADQTFLEQQPLTLWDRIFNEVNFSEDAFVGSVHDYFLAQSYGALDLTFDLHYVTLADQRTKYRSTSTDDENSRFLVCDIVDSLSTRGIDWSPYDWDDDGQIDQLLIIYAGKGMNDGGGTNSIWPHQWWLSEHDGGKALTVSSDGQDFLVDCYCCVQEVTSRNTYGTFGTICHEYSHCFGLPDLYNGSTSFLKSWDLMDSGNNNAGGYHPCSYSAHERWLMGWLTPVELTEDISVTDMPLLEEHPVAYLIRNDGYADEYYLLENRQPVGWDQSLPGGGLVVFHIDYDADTWQMGIPNTYSHKRYSIIPANNRTSVYQSAGWPYPYETNNLLTNDSQPAATLINPNTDGTLLMNKSITDITLSSDGLAAFRFSATTGTGIRETTHSTLSTPTVLYRLGPIHIIRNAQGKVQKVLIQYSPGHPHSKNME